MAPGGLGTPVLFFAPPISIHLSLSLYLSASVSLFSAFALLSPVRSMSLCPFPHLASQTDVGTEQICNSLSVFLSPYLSPNVFHLGFSISMSMQSLGCQTQLKGHYWQFRAWLSVRVKLIFLLSGRTQTEGEASSWESLVNVDFDLLHFQDSRLALETGCVKAASCLLRLESADCLSVGGFEFR